MAKQRTPEEQAKIDARMAKMRQARQNKNSEQKESMTTDEAFNLASDEGSAVQPEPVFQDSINQEPSIADLQRQIEELKEGQFAQLLAALKADKPEGVAATNGRLTGTLEKYLLAPGNYPDPTDRIKEEPRLQRFAFDINYELLYSVSVSEYETIDHIRVREPKFTVKLVRVIMDDDGYPTDGRYEIATLIMHEDPEAALVIAREQGIEVDDTGDEKLFLNEMRFLRMRDWVMALFYPAPIQKNRNQREMVIEGRLVNYYEVNNEEGRGMRKEDWDNAPRIKF